METRKPFTPSTTQLLLISLGAVAGVFLVFKWIGPGEWGPGVFVGPVVVVIMAQMNSRGYRLRMFAATVLSFAGIIYLEFHLTALGMVVAVLGQLAGVALVHRYRRTT
jgi:hypothetical protein